VKMAVCPVLVLRAARKAEQDEPAHRRDSVPV